MKTRRLLDQSPLVLLSFTLAVAALLTGHTAQAATKSWNNTGTDFNTTGNWTGGTPGTGDNATFTGSAVTNPNLSTGLTIQGLTFSNTTANGYTLSASAGQSLTLTNISSGGSAIYGGNASGTNTISAPIILGGAASSTVFFFQSGTGMLKVNGNISQANSGQKFQKLGAGTVILGGANTFSGGIVISNGTLALDYEGAASGTSTNYSVPSTTTVTLNGGTLEFKGKTGSNTTNQTIGNIGTTGNTGVSTIVVNKNSGTATTVTAGTLTRQGGSMILVDQSSGGSLTTSSTVTNGILSSSILVKDSTGRVDYAAKSGANITALNATTDLPSTSGVLTTNYALAGSQTLGGNVLANTLRINTTGTGQSLNLAGFNLTLNVAGVLFVGADDYSIGAGNLSNGGGATIIQNFGTGKLTINSTIGGSVGLSLYGNGSSLIDLTAAGVSGAATTTISGVTVRLSNATAILSTNATSGVGSNGVGMASGAVLELTSASGNLTRDLNGTVPVGAGKINMAGGNAGFSAYGVDRSVSLSSNAALTWASTAGFLVDGATLILGSNSSDSTLDFTNAISFGSSERVVEARDGTSSTNVDGKLSGVLSGSGGGLVKTGAGTLLLSNTNSYTGSTSIQVGKLIVTGAIHTSSGVAVSSGATLAGESSDSGSTNGKVSAITLSGGSGTGGILAPGNGTAGDLGTLYGTSLAWNGASDSVFSQMKFDLGSSNTSDSLQLSGAMTKGTGSIFEWDFGNTGVLDNTYTLVTASGGFGDFIADNFTYKAGSLASGLTGSFSITGTSLSFTTFSAVPEPTGALAGLLLGVGLLRRRRA